VEGRGSSHWNEGFSHQGEILHLLEHFEPILSVCERDKTSVAVFLEWQRGQRSDKSHIRPCPSSELEFQFVCPVL